MNGVRALAVADWEGVLRINAESLPGVACLDRHELERLLSMPNEHLAIEGPDGGLGGYLLAFRNDAPYDGEEFLTFAKSASESFIYIDQLAIETSYRQAGLGSILYEALELRAKNSLVARLCCEINLEPPNPTSLAFHRAKGFTQSGSLATTDGRMVALMVKPLVSTEAETRET